MNILIFIKNKIIFFYKREFRPSWFFHIPTFLIYLYFALKAKNIFFFSATNPSMYMGGFMNNSKEDTNRMIANKYQISKKNFVAGTGIYKIQEYIKRNNLPYPFIIKPTVGGRQGYHVYYIEKESDFKLYINFFKKIDFLVEEYVDGEEYSIYYYRNPNQKKGHILGITKKEYPSIFGDGERTIGELIKANDRYNRYYDTFEKYNINMGEIIHQGISKKISTIGNHCKGSMFIDQSHYITEELIKETDQLISQDFSIYLYRSDIKAQSRNDVVHGNYKIIEINGVFSEPTFIYDPNYKILDAYRQIYKVRYHTYKIATINHNEKNIPYFPISEGIKLIIQYLKK